MLWGFLGSRIKFDGEEAESIDPSLAATPYRVALGAGSRFLQLAWDPYLPGRGGVGTYHFGSI